MKVFDSFIFFNELELLEMRLNILNDVVDYFVLTESPFTVSGNEKPLYYQENKDLFGKFNDKIIHHVTEEIPNDFSHMMEKTKHHVAYNDKDPYGTKFIDIPIRFQRAIYNRNNSAFGIEKAGASDDDLIITSDADEIINPLVLSLLGDWFNPNQHYVALCRAFYYKLNFVYQEDWMGSRICTWKHLKSTTIDQHRQDHANAHKIEDAGWHFSFLGSAENFKLKLASYEHTENNTDVNVSNAEEKVEQGLDPLNRGMTYKSVPIDDTYPDYIVENQEKYAEFIKPWN
jgi:beta-1,4-mannosyl-glycoprotein beta-1,4-N-acetylglucosaminyltransferase